MRRLTFALLALAANATTAQGSVKNDSEWTDGNGTTVKVQVTDRPDGKVDVVFIDHTGFSTSVKGVRGSGGNVTSTTYTPPATTTSGTNTYRVMDVVGLVPCSVCVERPGGRWVPMKPVKKKTHRKPPIRSEAAPGLEYTGPEAGGSLPGGPQSL